MIFEVTLTFPMQAIFYQLQDGCKRLGLFEKASQGNSKKQPKSSP